MCAFRCEYGLSGNSFSLPLTIMSQVPSHSIELQPLQAQGAASNADRASSQPTLAPFAATGPSSGAVSPANNSGNAQSSVPKARHTDISKWKRHLEWWPELSGALLSVLVLIVIVIFLARIDGSKLEDWHLAWQIKPPTIVSILVTLCRIALAFFIAEGLGQLKWVFFEQRPHRLSEFEDFDEATRGPWGAICFIWKINRRAIVATFGAVMAILILAMDPFSQQVLNYETRTSNVTGAVAIIPSAQLYDSGALYAALSIDNQTATYDPIPQPTSTSAGFNNGPQTFGQQAGPATFGSLPSSTEAPSPDAFDGTRLVRKDDAMAGVSQGTYGLHNMEFSSEANIIQAKATVQTRSWHAQHMLASSPPSQLPNSPVPLAIAHGHPLPLLAFAVSARTSHHESRRHATSAGTLTTRPTAPITLPTIMTFVGMS